MQLPRPVVIPAKAGIHLAVRASLPPFRWRRSRGAHRLAAARERNYSSIHGYERRTRLLEYCLVASAFGPIGLLWSEAGLVRLALPDREASAQDWLLRGVEAAEADPPATLEPGIVKLQRYFAGVRVDLSDIPVDLTGVPDFFRTLYLEMRLLGWGETMTYGELGARVGAPPGAARAVGQAMGRNRLPVVIPCHRVLASNGRPGGFSAPGGVATKLRLLDMEGVSLSKPSRQLAFAF